MLALRRKRCIDRAPSRKKCARGRRRSWRGSWLEIFRRHAVRTRQGRQSWTVSTHSRSDPHPSRGCRKPIPSGC